MHWLVFWLLKNVYWKTFFPRKLLCFLLSLPPLFSCFELITVKKMMKNGEFLMSFPASIFHPVNYHSTITEFSWSLGNLERWKHVKSLSDIKKLLPSWLDYGTLWVFSQLKAKFCSLYVAEDYASQYGFSTDWDVDDWLEYDPEACWSNNPNPSSF